MLRTINFLATPINHINTQERKISTPLQGGKTDTFHRSSPVSFKGLSPESEEILELFKTKKPQKAANIIINKLRKGIYSAKNFEELDKDLYNSPYERHKADYYEIMIYSLEKTDKKNPVLKKLYLQLGNIYWDKANYTGRLPEYADSDLFKADKEQLELVKKCQENYEKYVGIVLGNPDNSFTSPETRLERAKLLYRLGDTYTLTRNHSNASFAYSLAVSEAERAFNSTDNKGKSDMLLFTKKCLNKYSNFLTDALFPPDYDDIGALIAYDAEQLRTFGIDATLELVNTDLLLMIEKAEPEDFQRYKKNLFNLN